MEWNEVLDPDLEPGEVLCDRIPRMHEDRLDQYRRLVKTPLIFSFVFTDTGDQYTVRLTGEGVETTSGDMIDFPQATARGTLPQWREAIELASRLVEPADDQIERAEGRIQVTDGVLAGFEKFDGVLEVCVTELPGGAGPLSFEVVLNDYTEPSWASRAKLEVKWPVLVELANGRLDPVEAARRVSVTGKMSLAFDLGGFFATEFDLE